MALRAFLAVLFCLLPARAAAQYPAKPLRFIVPFPPGGGVDIVARALGEKLGPRLGQSIVIENKPGGGTTIGTDAAAKSAPDGYTLLVMSNTHTVNESLIPKKPFVLQRDFVP